MKVINITKVERTTEPRINPKFKSGSSNIFEYVDIAEVIYGTLYCKTRDNNLVPTPSPVTKTYTIKVINNKIDIPLEINFRRYKRNTDTEEACINDATKAIDINFLLFLSKYKRLSAIIPLARDCRNHITSL